MLNSSLHSVSNVGGLHTSACCCGWCEMCLWLLQCTDVNFPTRATILQHKNRYFTAELTEDTQDKYGR